MRWSRRSALAVTSTVSWITATAACRPRSRGRRNGASIERQQVAVEGFGRGVPIESLARTSVDRRSHGGEVVGAVSAQVGALREVLSQQTVGVLVRSALPGT